MKNWKKLGEILVEAKIVASSDIEDALSQQESESDPRKLGEILLDMGLIDEVTLYQNLALQWSLDFVAHLELADVDTGLLEKFPLEHLRKIQTIPQYNKELVTTTGHTI